MVTVGETRAGGTLPGSGNVLLLRLYVAGDGPNSSEARANLQRILERRPANTYELEVVDFLIEPLRALKDGVIVTPTLVRLEPLPVRKIIGTLKETTSVVAALGLAEAS